MHRILTVTLNPALDLSTETPDVAPDRKLRCIAPRRDPGGGGVNVSRAIANLGGESLTLVALGGATGAEYFELLSREGLTPAPLGPEGATRQSLTVTEARTGRQFRFVTPGPDWSAHDVTMALDTITKAAARGDLLVPSGSLPPGVPADVFLTLNDRLAPEGVRMVVDTSGAALIATARAGHAPLAVLRMDRIEAEELAGHPLPTPEARATRAKEMVSARAAEIVAISGGAEGTVVATDQGAWSCAPPNVPVVSRVGAGDSFVAGMTLALSRSMDAAQACAWGVAAASAAVMTPDTQLCSKADTERCLAEVQIKPL